MKIFWNKDFHVGVCLRLESTKKATQGQACSSAVAAVQLCALYTQGPGGQGTWDAGSAPLWWTTPQAFPIGISQASSRVDVAAHDLIHRTRLLLVCHQPCHYKSDYYIRRPREISKQGDLETNFSGLNLNKLFSFLICSALPYGERICTNINDSRVPNRLKMLSKRANLILRRRHRHRSFSNNKGPRVRVLRGARYCRR